MDNSDIYSIELYLNDSNRWIKTVKTFNSYYEAREYIGKNPAPKKYYYSIFCIEFKENGDIKDYFPVY